MFHHHWIVERGSQVWRWSRLPHGPWSVRAAAASGWEPFGRQAVGRWRLLLSLLGSRLEPTQDLVRVEHSRRSVHGLTGRSC